MHQSKKFFEKVLFSVLTILALSSVSLYANEEPGDISFVVEASLDGTEQGQQVFLERVRLPEGIIGVRVYLNREPAEGSSAEKKRHIASVYGYGRKGEDTYNFVITLQQKVSGRVRITMSPVFSSAYKGTPGNISVKSVRIQPVDNSAFEK